MRVGLLLNRPLPELGGGHTYQQELLQAVVELAHETAHEFHVICEPIHAAGLTEQLLSRGNGQVRLAPMGRSIVPRAVRSGFRLVTRALGYRSMLLSREARTAAENRLDLLWSVGPYPHEALEFPLITPVFDLQHRIRPWFPEVSRGRIWPAREEYYGDHLRRSAYVVVGTPEGKAEVQRYYQVAEERIRVIPLPTPRFALHAKRSDCEDRLKALGLERGYLFYPAQFWPHKNHANLLLALQLLRDRHHLELRLVLAGSDQGNEAHVRRMIRNLGLDRQVSILGFVAQEDLVALYSGAEALAFVSFFGPDNLPPLEAGALGCPVVASNVPGVAEQLGDAALLVRPESPEDIADAIVRLRSEPLLRDALRERGLRRAGTWTSADYVRRIFSLLDEFESIRRCWGR